MIAAEEREANVVEFKYGVCVMLTPSMDFKNGTASQGKLATAARGSPYDKYFTNELEETLILSAKLKASDHFKFKQTPKLDPHRRAGTPVPNKILEL